MEERKYIVEAILSLTALLTGRAIKNILPESLIGPIFSAFLLLGVRVRTRCSRLFSVHAPPSHYFLRDGIAIGPIVILTLCSWFPSSELERVGFSLAAVTLTLLYLINTVSLSFFGRTTGASELFDWWREFPALIHFLSWRRVCWIGAALGVMLFPLNVPHSRKLLAAAVALFAALGVIYLFIRDRRRPTGDVTNEFSDNIESIERYSRASIDSLHYQLPRAVVIVMVESLSACDSYRTSGIYDNLPLFDSLSKRGCLFRNFFSNARETRTALLSLSRGWPNALHPKLLPNAWEDDIERDGIVRVLGSHGRDTRLIAGWPAAFQYGDSIIRRAGYQRAFGDRSVPRFDGKWETFISAPPDELLFDEALDQIRSLNDRKTPYLMTIITVSGHPPFSGRGGVRCEEREMWQYVQEELWRFYELLPPENLSDGLFIVVGDHRKYSEISPKEYEVYGEEAAHRVPLVIFGKNFKPGTLDHRPLQHSDLLMAIPLMEDSSRELSRQLLLFDNACSLLPGRRQKATLVMKPREMYRHVLVNEDEIRSVARRA